MSIETAIATRSGGPLTWPGRARTGVAARAARAAGMAAAVLAGTCLLTIVLALLTGHGFHTVLTGSMAPAIPVDSVIVSERTTAGAIRSGDVLVFPEPGRPDVVYVHRVVSVTRGGNGDVLVHTRGDANRADDPWTLEKQPSQAADRVVLTIPLLGHPVLLVRTLLPVLLALLAVLVVAPGVIQRLWRRP